MINWSNRRSGNRASGVNICRLFAVTDEGSLILEPAYLVGKPRRCLCLKAAAELRPQFGPGKFFTVRALVIADANETGDGGS